MGSHVRVIQFTPSNAINRLQRELDATPRPLTLKEHVVHYFRVRKIDREIKGWKALERIGITVVGNVMQEE